MSMLDWVVKKALQRVSAYLPENRIVIDGETYLRRFYLCGGMNDRLAELFQHGAQPVRQRLGFLPTMYLHQFYKPDADRDLHNHPWPAKAVVLSGGYIEERWVGEPGTSSAFKASKVVDQFETNVIAADTYHRIDCLIGEEVWTLIVLGPKTQSWGFWSDALARHVNHRDYKRGLE